MKFRDHMVDLLGWHYAADVARARYLALCTNFLAVVESQIGGTPLLQAAQELRRGVSEVITEALQANRKERKLAMLRSPDRLFNVIKELGGIEALLRWMNKPPPKALGAKTPPKKREPLSPQEEARRAHIRLCAKACANPRILRDRVRVDMSGQFRLAPRGRAARKAALEGKPKAPYDYRFDARPFTDLSGMKAPIWLWPDEIFVFLKYHQENRAARPEPKETERPAPVNRETVNRQTVKDWLDALLDATTNRSETGAAKTKAKINTGTKRSVAAIHKPP